MPNESLRTWVHQRAAASVLDRLLPRLATAGIPVLGVKGIVSARTLYQDVSERPISDIDLRVEAKHFGAVRRCIRELGGVEEVGTSNQWGTMGFVLDGILVEFESTIGPPGLSTVGVADLLRRATTERDWFKGPLLVPEHHDHALVMLVNVFKDKVSGAPPSAREDLRRTVAHAQFDREILRARLLDAGLTTVAYVVACSLGEGIGAEPGDPRWAEFARELQPHHAKRARRLRDAAIHGERTLTNALLFRAANDSVLENMRGLTFAALGTVRAAVERGLRRR